MDYSRFEKKIRRSPMCWEWTGAKSGKGYGLFMWRKPVVQYAHRAAWFFEHSEWPALCVCHRCDNRLCVRPSHLFLGTNADNNADMVAKGRQRGPAGERNTFSLLTDEDVLQIRTLATTGITQRELGEEFAVSQQCVSAIVNRKT